MSLDKVKPVVLVILDGWGIQHKKLGNPIAQAHLPEFNRIWNECPHTTLKASGSAVGLPEGVMGNSEVGHLNLGAGRVVLQDLVRINQAIAKSSFSHNEVLLKSLQQAKANDANVHFMGLLSDAGVHSDINHLFALLDVAKRQGCIKVWVHPFLDGRDTPPKSALKYLQVLEQKLGELKIGRIGSVMGRYYSMDRDNRWERTAKAYYAIALGDGLMAASAGEALEQAYRRGETDEFVLPTVIGADEAYGGFADGDCVVFFNFRSDRPRQLTESLFQKQFTAFDRKQFFDTQIVCMTQYDNGFKLPTLFQPLNLAKGLGEVISESGLRQLRIAETEKYAHVTFFFNGGQENPFSGEERILVNSPKVATYDQKPEMSAYEVTVRLIDSIKSGLYDFILVNYANPDMVAHTANFAATVRALEVVDNCLSKVVAAAESVHGLCVVTSDHGHAEQLIDYETGGPWTAHTTNRVPFVIVTEEKVRLHAGCLADVGPTILELMHVGQPKEMLGRSLLDYLG